MGLARLGDVTFRVNPNAIALDFSMDTSVQQTVGGRVVQVYGATLGDLVIRGSYGESRGPGQGGANEKGKGRSWQQAEAFSKKIRRLVDKQSTSIEKGGVKEIRPHNPHRFTFSYEDFSYIDRRRVTQSWDLNVFVKSLRDASNENVVIEHSTGKFAYDYVLTLFVVADRTGKLIQAGEDAFISRLSEGIGWQQGGFNGPTFDELQTFLTAESPGDDTIQGYLRGKYGELIDAPPPGPGT